MTPVVPVTNETKASPLAARKALSPAQLRESSSLTIEEVAKVFGYERRTILRLKKEKKVKGWKEGNQHRFLTESIVAYERMQAGA